MKPTRSLQSSNPQAGPLRRRAWLVMLALALCIAALLGWAIERGQPVPLRDAAVSRLPCVSYAPFRRAGHSPFDPALIVTPAQIEADLRLLREVTDCVRTYGVDHGLDALPLVARRLGMRVVLGAWIARDQAANAAQLDRALALSREFADVIDLLMVGNEVLLRREMSPQALAELLAQARQRSAVPVSYADVWEFWLRHGDQLRQHVDVVSVHVLPYWEDDPVEVGEAVDHLQNVAARLRQAFAPLPVFIAETGWPANGRQRGPAIPGAVEQTQFVRELGSLSMGPPTRTGLPAFNLIEAFDQPWKLALEGATGGYWGLFDAAGNRRVSLAGPVQPLADWQQLPLAALLGAGLGLVCGLGRGCWSSRINQPAGPRGATVFAWLLAGAGIGLAASWQWQMLESWSRNEREWAVGGLSAALVLCGAIAVALRLAHKLERGPWLPVRPGVVAAWATPGSGWLRCLASLHAALLFMTALAALGLVFDPRYRPLIWPAVWPAAILLLAIGWLGDRLASDAREERLLAAICAFAAPLVVWQEGLRNTQAWLAVAPWLMLAGAVWWPHRSESVLLIDGSDGCRTSTSAANSAAGAAQSSE